MLPSATLALQIATEQLQPCYMVMLLSHVKHIV